MMKAWVMMKTWLVILGIMVCSSVAQADTTVIFRTSDKLVTSWTGNLGNVQSEIGNAVNSPNLGGVDSDYDTVTVTDVVWGAKGNQLVTVTPGGQVVFIPDPAVQARENARNSGRGKLQALGLTDAEIDAL